MLNQAPPKLAARDRLIVALDVPTVERALELGLRLGDSVNFYKIGYQLALTRDGIALASALADSGKQVFLDLKIHDIGATVEKAVGNAASLGVTFLTVHAFPQTMQAAVCGRGASNLKLLAVTVLTSYDDNDLHQAGYRLGVTDLVTIRAMQAQRLGIDGLVCSPEEAVRLRQTVGPKMTLVTPGIRPPGTATDDQKRVSTPSQAIRAGADYLVVGRPIVTAADPKAVAEAIIDEIEQAS